MARKLEIGGLMANKCPWCGKEFIPYGYYISGLEAGSNTFFCSFKCKEAQDLETKWEQKSGGGVPLHPDDEPDRGELEDGPFYDRRWED